MQTNTHFGHAAYHQGQISSANPVRIIVLLYEGAIRFTRQAMEKFDEPATRGYALGRAHRIVSELLAALDHDAGGEIAANLDALYRFLLDEITCANVEGERKCLDGVVDVLSSLVGAWREIEAKPEAGNPSP
jgi:flagellar protein FliS